MKKALFLLIATVLTVQSIKMYDREEIQLENENITLETLALNDETPPVELIELKEEQVFTTEVESNFKVKKTKEITTDSFKAFITHYGPDCKACSGITASGYNVKNTIYYTDPEYGEVRVVASSKKIPMYSILQIDDYKYGSITAIVLDRGVNGNTIDILTTSESEASKLGIQKNVNVEILRRGRK